MSETRPSSVARLARDVRPISVSALLAAPPADPIADPAAAFADHYGRGFADGEAFARNQAGTRIASLQATQAATEDLARQALATIGDQFADSLAGLASAVARAVLGTVPAISTDTLQSLLAEVLQAAAGDVGVICVHPDHAARLQPMLPPGWALSTDPEHDPDRLTATLDPGRITASLDRRLAQLTAHLSDADAQ